MCEIENGDEKADQAAKSALNLLNITSYHYHIPISHLVLKNTYSPGGNTFGIIQLVMNSITSILLSLSLQFSVHCILISCIDFDIICQNFYTASNLKDLFQSIHPKRIISFCTYHWPY